MLLLQMVPEFQREIAKLRKKFDIPIGGYQSYYEEDFTEKEMRAAIKKTDDQLHNKLKQLGYFMPTPIGFVEKQTEPESFEHGVIQIGEKFRLPYNLYNGYERGVAWYALQGRILVPPQNWEAQNDPLHQDRPLPIRWAAIRAYAPLDKKEAGEAIATLNQMLRKNMPKKLVAEKRLHDNDERRLAEVAKMLERHQLKGKGRTRYVAGTYLDIARKSKGATEKKMRTLERQNPHDLVRATPMSDRERKMRERFNDLAIELFGFGLLQPDSKRTI